MAPLECIIIYDALLLLWMVAWGIFRHWKFDATLYISFFLFVCAVISTFYFEAVNGVFYDFSNITLVPFLYLVLCFLITSYPIMMYDCGKFNHIESSDKKYRFLELFVVFLIIASIEPFFEVLVKLPSSLVNESSIDAMYDQRLFGEFESPLSFIGRKLFRITTSFNYLYPIFLFYFLTRPKIKLWVVCGILMMMMAIWGHDIITSTRTHVVQSIFYFVVVYFIFYRFIPRKINFNIVVYGGSFLLIGCAAVAVVTFARFDANNYMEDMDLLTWVGLYAGEGNLNFNSLMWDVIKDTGGESTFVLLLDVLGRVRDVSVDANWDAIAKLGIPGNVFYTYVGSIYTDFGRIGTIIFVSILALVVRLLTITKGKGITLPKVIFICLLARILVLPTFYTYATYMQQMDLCCALLFCLAYSLCGRLYFGRRQVF